MPSAKSSLKDYDRLSHRIRQHQQIDKKPILVVEGESDKRLIDRLTDGAWTIFIASTRNNVTTSVGECLGLQLPRVAGLIDRDFDDHYENACTAGKLPVFSYDEADMEAAIIKGPWLGILLGELCSTVKLKHRGGVEAVRKRVIDIARVCGELRKLDKAHRWGIDFKKLDFARKVDPATLTLNVESLLDAIGNRVDPCDRKNFRSETSELKVETCNQRLFRGKDALSVLCVAFKKFIATSKSPDVEFLAGSLRATVDKSFLQITPFPAIFHFFEQAPSQDHSPSRSHVPMPRTPELVTDSDQNFLFSQSDLSSAVEIGVRDYRGRLRYRLDTH